jgi:hypothetical protein
MGLIQALGSSAPEILLATIETVGTLGGEPGELGPSTIVGARKVLVSRLVE